MPARNLGAEGKGIDVPVGLWPQRDGAGVGNRGRYRRERVLVHEVDERLLLCCNLLHAIENSLWTLGAVLAAAGITGATALVFLDVDEVRQRLKGHPWIADATVLKLYPGELQIGIKEREAFALWRQEETIRTRPKPKIKPNRRGPSPGCPLTPDPELSHVL